MLVCPSPPHPPRSSCLACFHLPIHRAPLASLTPLPPPPAHSHFAVPARRTRHRQRIPAVAGAAPRGRDARDSRRGLAGWPRGAHDRHGTPAVPEAGKLQARDARFEDWRKRGPRRARSSGLTTAWVSGLTTAWATAREPVRSRLEEGSRDEDWTARMGREQQRGMAHSRAPTGARQSSSGRKFTKNLRLPGTLRTTSELMHQHRNRGRNRFRSNRDK